MDTAHSRIPRLDGVSSRIPVPGSFRVPSSTVRLPSKRAALPPPATPISFLRPPSQSRSGAISIARSYSGDKLFNGEPSPFPLLTASTPAPGQLRLGLTTPKSSGLPFLKKLEQVAAGTSERLEDIKLCQREFAIPSDDDEDDDGEGQCGPDATVQMLVDESLELVGANSTDNLLDPPTSELPCGESNATIVIASKHTPMYARNEHTVTLQRDGNVTYEIRRSGTFVKSSRESLSSPQDRPRPPVLSQTHTRSHTSLSSNVLLGLTKTFRRESTESIDSPVLDLTRTMPFRRPSTGELLIEEDGNRRPPILSSTMVNERLLNVTQSIPNITQELLYADVAHEPCPAPGDSVLHRTASVEEHKLQRGLGAGSKTKLNRLTFNLEDSVNLMEFSACRKDGQTQVFSSTLHSDSMAIPAATGSGSSGQVMQLAGSQHSTTMLLMDISAQDRTLVPSELELDRDRISDDEEQMPGYSLGRRNMDQREVSIEADVSAGKEIFDLSLDEPEPCCQDDEQQQQQQNQTYSQQEVVLRRHMDNRSNTVPPPKQRYSFGLDLTECTLDCSIELCDSSLSLTKPAHLKSPTSSLTKQGSFEMDESLGILTPDQMKEFLDSTTTNTNTNNTNNAANAAGLELQLNTGMGGSGSGSGTGVGHHHHKHGALQHHCRIDQTPSPEELPLDPVGVKTDMSDIMLPAELLLIAGGPQPYGGSVGSGQAGVSATGGMSELSQADSDPKTDQMTKSATSSKVSNSFITSITSITSLDTGYQGDGEMSRPASRGADHSPSNGPRVKSAIGGGAWQPMMAAAVAAVPRRQDPMTDSDFFTESDADDVFNRGDARRAQIIDGQLYGAPGGAGGIAGAQGANAIFNAIDEQDDQDLQQQHHQQNHQDAGQNEDSCMESSGIFTDVENRADDDLVQRRADDQQQAEAAAEGNSSSGRRGFDEDHQQATDDMSPDVSTDTMSSSNSQNFVRVAEQQHARDDDPNQTCKLVLDEREKDITRCCDDGKSNLSQHIGASPKADEHHYHQFAITTMTALKSDGDIGTGVSTTAGATSPGSGSGGVVVIAGNVARRCDADSFHDVSGKRSAACGNSTNSATSHSGSSAPSASRKQLKNEANRGLRKHHQQHASGAEMSASCTASSRTDRLSKTRLSKDLPDGTRGGVSIEQCNGGDDSAIGVGDCDQENKRPSVGGTRGMVGTGVGVSARGGGATGSNLSFVKKSNTPNKWDAVMSKIAENKSVMRRNFSDVKSRISCGSGVVSAGASKGVASTLLRRDSPATSGATGSLKSPPSECTSVASRSSAHGKRTISGSVKRRNSGIRGQVVVSLCKNKDCTFAFDKVFRCECPSTERKG
uniref:Uncharacterized protein n=1 Tax=Anopheles culicifacies TaxID=139723 RepID=A0A182MIM0_9DIPT